MNERKQRLAEIRKEKANRKYKHLVLKTIISLIGTIAVSAVTLTILSTYLEPINSMIKILLVIVSTFGAVKIGQVLTNTAVEKFKKLDELSKEEKTINNDIVKLNELKTKINSLTPEQKNALLACSPVISLIDSYGIHLFEEALLETKNNTNTVTGNVSKGIAPIDRTYENTTSENYTRRRIK